MSQIKRQRAVAPQPTAHLRTQLSITNSSSSTQAPPTTIPTASSSTRKLSGIHCSLRVASQVKRQIMTMMEVIFTPMNDVR